MALACQALIERAAADVGAPAPWSRLFRAVANSANAWSTTPRGPGECHRFGAHGQQVGHASPPDWQGAAGTAANNAVCRTPSADLSCGPRHRVLQWRAPRASVHDVAGDVHRSVADERRTHRVRVPDAANRGSGRRGHPGRSADPRVRTATWWVRSSGIAAADGGIVFGR